MKQLPSAEAEVLTIPQFSTGENTTSPDFFEDDIQEDYARAVDRAWDEIRYEEYREAI